MLRHTSVCTIHQKHILNASQKIVNGFSARKAISGKLLPWKNTAKNTNGQLIAILGILFQTQGKVIINEVVVGTYFLNFIYDKKS